MPQMDAHLSDTIATEMLSLALPHVLAVGRVSSDGNQQSDDVTLMVQASTIRLLGVGASYHGEVSTTGASDDLLYQRFQPLAQRWREYKQGTAKHLVLATAAHLFFKDACFARFNGGDGAVTTSKNSNDTTSLDAWTAPTAKLFQGWLDIACADIMASVDALTSSDPQLQVLQRACAASAINFVATWLSTEARGSHNAGGWQSDTPTALPRPVINVLDRLSAITEALCSASATRLDVALSAQGAVLHLAQVVAMRDFNVPLFSQTSTTPRSAAASVVRHVWAAIVGGFASPAEAMRSVAQYRAGRIVLQRILQLVVALQSTADAHGLPSHNSSKLAALALLSSTSAQDSEAGEYLNLCFRFIFAKETIKQMLLDRRRRKESGGASGSATSDPLRPASSMEATVSDGNDADAEQDSPVAAPAPHDDEDTVSSDAILAVRGILVQGARRILHHGKNSSSSARALTLPSPWLSSSSSASQQRLVLRHVQVDSGVALTWGFRLVADAMSAKGKKSSEHLSWEQQQLAKARTRLNTEAVACLEWLQTLVSMLGGESGVAQQPPQTVGAQLLLLLRGVAEADKSIIEDSEVFRHWVSLVGDLCRGISQPSTDPANVDTSALPTTPRPTSRPRVLDFIVAAASPNDIAEIVRMLVDKVQGNFHDSAAVLLALSFFLLTGRSSGASKARYGILKPMGIDSALLHILEPAAAAGFWRHDSAAFLRSRGDDFVESMDNMDAWLSILSAEGDGDDYAVLPASTCPVLRRYALSQLATLVARFADSGAIPGFYQHLCPQALWYLPESGLREMWALPGWFSDPAARAATAQQLVTTLRSHCRDDPDGEWVLDDVAAKITRSASVVES